MFTGLIREIANVKSFVNDVLTIQAQYKPKIGDSIAINGACLTAVSISNDTFSVELSPESSKLLAIQNYKVKSLVNIETDMFARYVYNLLKKDNEQLSWEQVDNTMFRY